MKKVDEIPIWVYLVIGLIATAIGWQNVILLALGGLFILMFIMAIFKAFK
ncbi:MAG: hypothetical protein ACP5JP_10555 [bacterium]